MENNFSEEVQRHLKGAKKVVESLPEVAGNVTKSWSLPEILSENFSGSLAKKFTGSDNLLKEIAIKVTGEWRVCQWWQLACKDCHKSYWKVCHCKLLQHWIFPQTNSLPCSHLVHMCGFLREFLCEIFREIRVLFLASFFFHFLPVEGIPDSPMLYSSSIFTLHKIWSTQPPKIPSRLKKCKPYH